MTAAISLPDALFETAEQAAQRLGISRNALFETALLRYLQDLPTPQTEPPTEETQSLTDRFNAVYRTEDSRLDPLFVELQARSLPQEDEW